MKPNIWVTHRVVPEVEQFLSEHFTCTFWREPTPVPYETLRANLAETEGIITAKNQIDAPLLAQAPRLRAVSTMSAGYDHLDVAALKHKGITPTHTPGVLNETVADLVMGLILSTARRLPELDRLVKQGRWIKEKDRENFGVDVHKATLGIVGMGGIGEAVAKRARYGFDMEVCYHNRSRKPEAEARWGLTWLPLEALLQQSDFVLLMVPLTEQTRHMFGARQFQSMKQTAYFINASRGQTVDEDALIEALRSKQIAGAGLDVFDVEPLPAGHPLLELDHVVTVPHIGSATEATRLKMAMTAALDLKAVLSGEQPKHPIR